MALLGQPPFLHGRRAGDQEDAVEFVLPSHLIEQGNIRPENLSRLSGLVDGGGKPLGNRRMENVFQPSALLRIREDLRPHAVPINLESTLLHPVKCRKTAAQGNPHPAIFRQNPTDFFIGIEVDAGNPQLAAGGKKKPESGALA
jgi:hypothetical protein